MTFTRKRFSTSLWCPSPSKFTSLPTMRSLGWMYLNRQLDSCTSRITASPSVEASVKTSQVKPHPKQGLGAMITRSPHWKDQEVGYGTWLVFNNDLSALTNSRRSLSTMELAT